MLRRLGALVVAAVVVLVLSGCGEDAQQQAAREATQEHVAALATARDYVVAETHCTDSARTFLRIEETDVFICAVPLVEGGCDWFRAEAAPGAPRIRLMDRDADCILPK